MRRTTVAALALATLLASAPLHAAEITGRWTAEFSTQVGVQKYTFDLKADGDVVTGTAHFERMGETGEAALQDGKRDGDAISFTEMLSFQGSEVPITYEGTLEGDEISFTRHVGDFAVEEFKATRAKD